MRQATGQGRTSRPERQAGVFAVACAVVPLALSGCNSTASKPALTDKPAAGSYGYAPVRVMAFADGTRVAMPTTKPSVAALADAKSAVEATNAVVPAAPADDAAKAEALKADVADRKAEQASLAIADLSAAKQSFKPGAEPAAGAPVQTAAVQPSATAPGSSPVASNVEQATKGGRPHTTMETVAEIAAVPVKGARAVAGGAKQAVASTIETVGDGAEAAKDVTVAAIDTTVDTARRVRQRIGDTFKGTDTITGSSSIDQLIEKAAAENNIPSDLAYAVVRVESHYNPTAIGGGAYGLSQIKPATARGLGFAGPAKGLFDPETNLRYGMKYLAGAWELSGHDVCGTAMRYKGGHRTTSMSKAASVYCSNVKRHMAAIERRRGPVNKGTITAAAERQKTVAVASREALPGVPLPTSRTIVSAAASDAGRRVAAAAPVVSTSSALATPSFAAPVSDRGGRVTHVALD
ncbi:MULTISPECIES: lytic transglycosylase domain-containing protein [unclassified Aureimonas]|uniref:lytic transglycosylase domain-containing protein n=1 Tax=unclassified Aureimonas TaxID=2615206 RepID=UPI000A80F9C6|nr:MULTISPECIES: lytic transglycosylase domain-containing protein [unclassified Aureimonas]